MRDLRWDEVDDLLDVDNGILPDVTVTGTAVADWQTVLDLIQSGDWAYEYSQEDHPGLLPSAGEILDRAPGMGILLKVWPAPDVMAIFRFYSAEAIDFDVDLRELQGQEPLDALCAFFRAIGGRLGKPVVMTFEGTSVHSDVHHVGAFVLFVLG